MFEFVSGTKHEVRPDLPLLDRQLQQTGQPLQLRNEARPLFADRGRKTFCRMEQGRKQHKVCKAAFTHSALWCIFKVQKHTICLKNTKKVQFLINSQGRYYFSWPGGPPC